MLRTASCLSCPHTESEPWRTERTACNGTSAAAFRHRSMGMCTGKCVLRPLIIELNVFVRGLNVQPAVSILNDSQLLVRRFAGQPLSVQKGVFAAVFCHVVPSGYAGPGTHTHTRGEERGEEHAKWLQRHSANIRFSPEPSRKNTASDVFTERRFSLVCLRVAPKNTRLIMSLTLNRIRGCSL